MPISLKEVVSGESDSVSVPKNATAAQINNLISLASNGDTIDFYKNDSLVLDAPLVCYGKVLNFRGNGCTLKLADSLYSAGAFTGMLRVGQSVQGGTYSSATLTTTFTCTINTTSVIIPAGTTLPGVGDIIKFFSTDVFLSVGTYLHGMVATVTDVDVSNRIVYINAPFYATFTCTSYCFFTGYGLPYKISGFIFDQTNHPNLVDLSTFCVHAIGNNVEITGNTLKGNRYSQRGIFVHGDGSEIHNNKISGFFNSQGITGGGRLGYGVSTDGNNTNVHSNVINNCKHAVTTACRYAVVHGYRVYGNTVYESATENATLCLGCLDVHAGVSDVAIIENNSMYALGYAMQFRCASVSVKGNTVRKLGNDSNPTILAFEYPAKNHEYIGNTFVQQSANVLFSNTFGTVAQGTFVFDGNTIDGGTGVRLFNLPNVEEIKFNNNTHKNADGSSLMITLNDNAAVSNLSFKDNNITVRSGGTDIFTAAGVNASSRLANYSNVFVTSNKLDGSLIGASSGYLLSFSDAIFTNLHVDGNIGKRAGARGLQISRSNITDVEITKNILTDTQILVQSASVACTLTRVNIEQNRAQLLNVTEGTADIVLIDTVIGRNKLNGPGTGRALTYVPRVGTTAPAAGNVVRLVNNYITNTSGVACATIGANAAGHKWLFEGNSFSAPLEDLSGVYFGTGKNYVGNTVQTYAAQATITAAVTLTGASKNIAIPVNTTAGAFSITMPATPAYDDTYTFVDANSTWGINNLTLITGTLHSVATNKVLNVSSVPCTLKYINSTIGWVNVN